MKKNQRLSKQQIIELYQSYMKEFGDSPGRERFCSWVNLTIHQIIYYWPKYSDFVIEAGGKANELNIKTPEAIVFEDYARICLFVKKVPTTSELRIAERSLETKTSRIGRAKGGKQDFLNGFKCWLEEDAKNEFKEILNYQGWKITSLTKPSNNETVSKPLLLVQKTHPFLPTCLSDFSTLARNENGNSALLPQLSGHALNFALL